MRAIGSRRRPRTARSNRREVRRPNDRGRLSGGVPTRVRDGLAELGGLRVVTRSTPTRRTAGEIARTFRALSDPSRVRLLGALVRAPLCPCLMQRIEPMKNSVLSYHLRVLKGAGLVTTSAASHYRIYEVTARGKEAVRLFQGPRPARPARGMRRVRRPMAGRSVPSAGR